MHKGTENEEEGSMCENACYLSAQGEEGMDHR